MKEAINEVKSSKYAFLEASQTMLQILSWCNYLMNNFVFEMFRDMLSRVVVCLVKLGA